ncbi:hypothetical protein AB5I41_04320 [Sphingomonas sp. MMS24-JH45]
MGRRPVIGLLPGLGLRIELPALALVPFVNHYHVLASDRALWERHGQLGAAVVADHPIVFDGAVVTRLGNRVYQDTPAAARTRVTSRARGRFGPHGGITVGASLLLLGWARLTPMPAVARPHSRACYAGRPPGHGRSHGRCACGRSSFGGEVKGNPG